MENEEASISFLDRPLSTKSIGGYLDKKEYAGKTVQATLKNVSENQSFKGKLVLQFLIEGDEDDRLMTIGPKNQNQLIQTLGNTPSEWINKDIVLEFGELQEYEITRNGVKQTQEGVEVTISKV